MLQWGKYLSEVCPTVGELAKANAACGSCPYVKHCAGGCRAVALTLTGDKLGVDLSKCLFFKGGYCQRVEACLEGWRNLAPISV